MGVSNVPAASAAGLQPRYVKFTSSGTFTLPTGYGVSNPLPIDIQVIGGGGGGVSGRSTISGNVTNNLNGTYNDYFGNGQVVNHTRNVNFDGSVPYNLVSSITGKGGGSGGVAQTKMYLTGNLTITIGAAGARPSISTAAITSNTNFNNYITGSGNNLQNNDNSGAIGVVINQTASSGGTGGTTTAGAVSATGGVGASGNFTYTLANKTANGGRNVNATSTINWTNTDLVSPNTSLSSGSAGQPAGSAGDATPLLGALAGGSGSTTPIYGAYGIGGIKNDAGTHTGVEGTGGGFDSVGASGAVVITYWS